MQAPPPLDPAIAELDRQRFERHGYLIVRQLAPASLLEAMEAVTDAHLAPLLGPAEFEADVAYPGAPADRLAPGGQTPRRLLHALSRDRSFRAWALSLPVARRLEILLGGPVALAQGHHNCVMTKYPGFSSETAWHQDIRYWSFDRPELISVWLALGAERPENGGLRVLPGSHAQAFDRGRLDAALFLRPELEDNQALLASAVDLELQRGDVLFFHSRLFHAAGRNETGSVKRSVVFTYHRQDNLPIPGTRSDVYPSLPLA
jgi:phytanoyl-CoA hydroxylase